MLPRAMHCRCCMRPPLPYYHLLSVPATRHIAHRTQTHGVSLCIQSAQANTTSCCEHGKCLMPPGTCDQTCGRCKPCAVYDASAPPAPCPPLTGKDSGIGLTPNLWE